MPAQDAELLCVQEEGWSAEGDQRLAGERGRPRRADETVDVEMRGAGDGAFQGPVALRNEG